MSLNLLNALCTKQSRILGKLIYTWLPVCSPSYGAFNISSGLKGGVLQEGYIALTLDALFSPCVARATNRT